ncbi:MAG: PHB depolymerase family esterase [Candidatus Neomarinimicrobiota bacterium]|jgi:predicted esterase|nr:PHB depolymerase family esterase [Candidatus Neomarinimicrobiota bacterium]MDX9781344.1 PHB depolymerase family esterase [bacterium]
MKKFLFCLLLALLPLAAQKPETLRDFGDNPGNLRMYRYVPQGLDPQGPYPLIVVLHGSMLNAATTHRCGGWARIADSLHCLILYPEQRFANNPVRAFNVLFGLRKQRLWKEAESVMAMIGRMIAENGADPQRIYVAGFSAGGSMANALLHLYPQRFQAGALLAAPSFLPREIIGEMPRIPRLAIIQGEQDPVVPPDNATEILLEWLNKYPPGTLERSGAYPYRDNPHLRAQFFRREGETVLLRLDMSGVTHQMPVDPGPALPQGGRHSLYSVDINIYLNYWIAGFFGLQTHSDVENAAF